MKHGTVYGLGIAKAPVTGLRREMCKMTMSRKTKAGVFPDLQLYYIFLHAYCQIAEINGINN